MKEEIRDVLDEAKKLAKRYMALTGKPLGITGEVAEFTAATLLNLELTDARQEGYDAIRIESGKEVKIQIKGRCLYTNNPSQKLGKIQINKEWDIVALVLLDKSMEPVEIYEADRKSVVEALIVPGSKARNERGQLSVSKFKSIGKKVWG